MKKFNSLYLQTMPFILSFLIVLRAFRWVNVLSYLLPIFLLINILIANKQKILQEENYYQLIILLLYPFFTLISTVWSIYPFYSLIRSLYYIFLIIGLYIPVKLLFYNIKEPIIKLFLPANLFLILSSLISLIFKYPYDSWSGGNKIGFMGFTLHQNTLAAAIFFTIPGVWILLLNKNKSLNFILLIILLLNLFIIIISHSRAVILAFLATFIFYIVLSKSIKLVLIVSAIFFIISISYFLIIPINNLLNDYILKGGKNIWERRIFLWEASFEAAKKGNILGLGYGVSDPLIKTPDYAGSYYKYGMYIREKGNSLLAIIEETGIVGLFLFLLPLYEGIRRAVKNLNKVRNSIQKKEIIVYLSFLIGYFIHAQFEAWWVGVGSIQLPFYYMLLFILLFVNIENYKSFQSV